jgi:hypothetical protein
MKTCKELVDLRLAIPQERRKWIILLMEAGGVCGTLKRQLLGLDKIIARIGIGML